MATATKASETRTAHLGLRLTPSLKQMLMSQAESRDMTLTGYLAYLANLDAMLANKLLEVKNG